MDVSIIIVNWNVKELLYRCLQSIFIFANNLEYEIIVVDNFSLDGSVQMLNDLSFAHKNLRVIFNQENAGFARANNQGLQVAQGKYALFMNPDMELVENTPHLLFHYLEARPGIAACTCQLQYGEGNRQPNIKRDPTFWSQLWILYKLHHIYQPPFLKKYLAKNFEYAREQEVEQVMGAFIFTRREVMKKIGGWSEDYFLWWEDIDLCKRLRQLGEVIVYTPISRVLHYEGRSFARQLSFSKQRRFNRGLLTYFKKYHNRFAWFVLFLASIDSLGLAWVSQLFRFKPRSQSKL
ncbi:MAG: glycosyltransferase family 2 protein [Patescibacteria group bacterium]